MLRAILRGVLVVSALCSVCFTLQAAGDGGRPALSVETVDGVHRIWVETGRPDGSTDRTLLRETTSSVTPRSTGGDPDGRALFAQWTEGGADTWTAWSRDAGRTWSKARSIETDLGFLEGAVAPGLAIPAPAEGLALPAGGRVFLVQFRSNSLPEWRAALEAAGGEIVGFFPHHAHLVRMAPGLRSTLEGLEFVERVEPFHPS